MTPNGHESPLLAASDGQLGLEKFMNTYESLTNCSQRAAASMSSKNKAYLCNTENNSQVMTIEHMNINVHVWRPAIKT